MKPLKVKILGSGNAAQKHARAFAELPELYQVVECDDHDILDICTPNYMHYQQVSASLAASHVIVEKPICGSLAEIDLLARIEERGAQRIIPIFQYRFADPIPLTPVIPYKMHYTRNYKFEWQRDDSYYSGWRGQWDTAIGGCMTSHGIHVFDLMLYHFGMPSSVEAWITSTFHETAVEDYATFRLDTPQNDPVNVWIEIREDAGNSVIGDQHLGFVTQFRLTHEALTSGGPLPVTLAEARQSLEVLTAAYWSAYTGEPVMLPIEPDHPFYGGWSKAFAERVADRFS
jgi:predicted dehydrogenase